MWSRMIKGRKARGLKFPKPDMGEGRWLVTNIQMHMLTQSVIYKKFENVNSNSASDLEGVVIKLKLTQICIDYPQSESQSWAASGAVFAANWLCSLPLFMQIIDRVGFVLESDAWQKSRNDDNSYNLHGYVHVSFWQIFRSLCIFWRKRAPKCSENGASRWCWSGRKARRKKRDEII